MRWVLERVSGGVRKMPSWSIERGIVGGETLYEVAILEANSQPEALAAGTGGEGLALQALRVVESRRN